MSVQKQQLFKHFKTTNGSFSVVSHCIFEVTCILLESPFHAELNGLCPNSVLGLGDSQILPLSR